MVLYHIPVAMLMEIKVGDPDPELLALDPDPSSKIFD
jgi:hypothetical protein